MLFISHKSKRERSKNLPIDHLKLDGTVTKPAIEPELKPSNTILDTNTMAPFATSTLPPQQPSLESLVLDDVLTDVDDSTIPATTDVQPIKIEITPAPKHRKSFSFSWEDFPLLQEDCVYVDSSWQKRKATIAETELVSTSSHHLGEATRPQHDQEAAGHKRSKTIATSSVFTVPVVRKTHQKSVSFDAVHIREHSVTIGDHEWCEGTLAISLDWPHIHKPKSMLIDDYENLRERQGRVPRGRLPKLDHDQRKQLLKRVANISEEDLQLIEYTESGREDSASKRRIAGLPRVMTIPNLPAALEQVDDEMNTA